MSNIIIKPSTTDVETTNLIVKNVEFFWAKLGKPVENQFSGDTQWELQARVPASRKADIEKLGTIKHPMVDGKEDTKIAYVNLRKKATRVDGTPAQPVRVVDAAKNELDGSMIGNGSKGNIIVMQKPYEIKNPKTGKVTKSGIATSLSAVQVLELVEFRKSGSKITDMFDVEGEAVAQTTSGDDF